jgi:hypothetical protein
MEKLNNNLNIMLSILFIVHLKNIYIKKNMYKKYY